MLIVFLTAGALAAEGERQWVRLHLDARDSGPASRTSYDALSDYGSFQWGQLEQDKIEELRREGQRVVVEENPFELALGGRRFDPARERSSTDGRKVDPQGDFYLIQFKGPIRKGWLRSLRARGIELVQPLHPFSYIVWSASGPMNAAGSMPGVRWNGPVQTDWKLPPGRRISKPGKRPTMALASTHADVATIEAKLAEFGTVRAITSLDRHLDIVHMEADGRDYPDIAAIPGILTVQQIPRETALRGEMSNQSIVGAIDESGTLQPGYQAWLNDSGYDGSGIVVAVVDGPVLTSHQDLDGREAACTGTNGSCNGSGSSAHGTHIAGAIVGTGASGKADVNGFLRGQGVAPGAKIVTQVYQPFLDTSYPGAMTPDGMLRIYQDSVRSGALLTNNSWGPTGSPQGYDIPTRQVDMITRDADPDTPGNQPLLPVWSIMNGGGDGSGTCSPSSLGSPDEAKNLFAVGSNSLQNGDGTQRTDIFDISSNSGHGPACDGRRVPHIVAPGCWTDSTSTNSSGNPAYELKCGTSMAAPVVSGSIAVWVQKFFDRTSTYPSPALVKAVFTASARNLVGETNADGEIMGHRPDRFQGYGRLDLDSVMKDDSPVLLYDQKTVFNDSGQHWSLEFKPSNPGKPVRVMLAWTDAPGHGLGGETPAWVNNLDLSLDAGGYTYLGNVIGSDGSSEAGGTADEKNNLEGLYLPPEQQGSVMSAKVVASELAGDALSPYDPGSAKQDFALVCHNCRTYTVDAEPAVLEACVPPEGQTNQYDVTVDLASIGEYSADVELDTSGEPGGVVQTLVPNPVTLPGASTWTLTIDDSAIPGESTVFIEGDDGQLRNSDRLTLDIDAYLDTAPSMSGPADGAELDELRPTFSWSPLSDVGAYDIQIATDDSFGNIIFDGNVDSPSFTPASDLEKWSKYYWRVRGINNCGEGEWSEAFSLSIGGVFADRFEASD
ncbi:MULTISPECIES: S8 family serine peptidase [unclassified Wenzhouxiangella]|uniref:S8 family serine peptidase n=1 Tax=unclassified Wenzhouxiangella TaxID=2613841 RepID=UPI0015F24D7E|nr:MULTISPECIES: S8 family serine peptidase [unclassified Wenzhouxiangella]